MNPLYRPGFAGGHHATAQARTPVSAAVIATRAVLEIIALPVAWNRHARRGSPHVAARRPDIAQRNDQGHTGTERPPRILMIEPSTMR
ncbi:MAG: hypothetical protein E6F99_29885 [Actinobacteria bacterium]|nr:MAG: hypothetical protein E6F99_29885 [Actinomycetota bacterium]